MTACVGLCAAFAAGAEKLPQRPYQPPLTCFCVALGETATPCTKSAESDGFHNPSQKPDFPGKPWTIQRDKTEAGESPDALCARPVTSTRSAGGFPGVANGAVLSWPIAR